MVIKFTELKNLKVEINNKEYCVSLIDKAGYEIVRGYGETVVEAINDLHSNLI